MMLAVKDTCTYKCTYCKLETVHMAMYLSYAGTDLHTVSLGQCML